MHAETFATRTLHRASYTACDQGYTVSVTRGIPDPVHSSLGLTPSGNSAHHHVGGNMSKSRKNTVRIELTEEQVKKIQDAMDQEGASLEPKVEELEERIAPKMNTFCM
jgi:hypothetical protein